MYRSLFLIIALLFTACANKNISIVKKENKSLEYKISKALFYEYENQPSKALALYIELFKEQKDLFFLKQAFLVKINFNIKNKDLIKLLGTNIKDKTLKRLEVLYYIQEKNLLLAKQKLQLLLKKDKYYKNYELLADLLLAEKKIKKALKYYKIAFDKENEKSLLIKYASLLIESKNTKKARILLENNRARYPNDLALSLLLIQVYKDSKSLKLIQSYEELYVLSQNIGFIYAAIEYLNKEEKYKDALDLALKYKIDVNTMIFLYYVNKNLKKALELSEEAYEITKDKSFLLRAAIFEYELNPKNAKKAAKKFQKGLDENSQALYLNYYGYLLIDEDMDVKYGISLVKKALEKDPKNLFYLDSLAWGYYKLGLCEKAWQIFEKLILDKEIIKAKEIKYHIKKARKCKNNEKN